MRGGAVESFEKNKERHQRKCLKCGRKFVTDRCHRICRKCTKENYDVTPVSRHELLRGSEFFYDDFEIE